VFLFYWVLGRVRRFRGLPLEVASPLVAVIILQKDAQNRLTASHRCSDHVPSVSVRASLCGTLVTLFGYLIDLLSATQYFTPRKWNKTIQIDGNILKLDSR